MNDYVKASDLKINDVLFLSENGEVKEYTKINEIKSIVSYETEWLIFNDRYIFKFNGSKGFTFRPIEREKKYQWKSYFESYEKDCSILFSSDKRVATTHAVNYLKNQIKIREDLITQKVKEMNDISNKIASLRFEEHN